MLRGPSSASFSMRLRMRNSKADCLRERPPWSFCIGNFRSDPFRRAGKRMLESMLRRASEDEGCFVEQAGAGLEKIVAQSLRQSPPAEAPLMAWPVVCGSGVAERTRALSFKDGVLL